MSDPYKYRHDDETYETPEAFQHVQDMTRFGLHSKSDIACELAGRDRRIAELDALLRRATGLMRRALYGEISASLEDECDALTRLADTQDSGEGDG